MGAGSSTVSKFYPVQGSNKFETVSFPITKAFRINLAAGTSKTNKLFAFPKGSIIQGFQAKVVTLPVMASDTATFNLGFVGTPMYSSKILSSQTAVGAVIGPQKITSTAAATLNGSFVPTILSTYITTSFTFQVVASDSFTAGEVDVYVTYIPVPTGTLSTSDFLSYATT